MKAEGLLGLGLVVVVGCGQGRGSSGQTTAAIAADGGAPAGSVTGDSAAIQPTGTAAVAPVAPAPGDDDERVLHAARLLRLRATPGAGGRPGALSADLEGGRAARAEPASNAAPTSYRVPVAVYRLARALGMDVVPVTVLRAVPLGELAAAAEGDAGARAALADLRVQNDGTVDVLLATPSSASAGSPWEAAVGTRFDPSDEKAVGTWQQWAATAAPAPGEDGALLRGYVEMLALDYLSANLARRAAVRTRRGLVLAESGTAFPQRLEQPSLDRLLRRLRAVARFPRGLRDALARFDRTRAAAVFQEGPFPTWLLSPRAVIELDERRAALLTLIEARIAERGPDAVLSL